MPDQRARIVSVLTDGGVLPAEADVAVTSLGGGVSNHVLRISWASDCVVAKRPRPNLAVEADWPADVGRVHNEAAAARIFERSLAAVADVDVPAVRFEDRETHVVAMECVPETATMWKRHLLAGRVDTRVAEQVGRALGRVHDRTAGDRAVREGFEHSAPFEQLRLDPYHRTVAERYPDLAEPIASEIDRVRSVERVLVHGDYSPKNVLVGDSVWLLDFEVAHYGDPAFDIAFMLNHLLIKSVYNAENQDAYLDAAEVFIDAYLGEVEWGIPEGTATELAVLMLARVDGKSPVEYVEEGPVADALRTVGSRALRRNVTDVESYVELLREATEGARS